MHPAPAAARARCGATSSRSTSRRPFCASNGRVHGYVGASAAAAYQQQRRGASLSARCTAPAVEAAAAAAAAAPAVDAAQQQPQQEPSPVTAMDIRVGQIKSIEKHPDADSLYVEQVDVGEPELRTIVSGLVKFVSAEDMTDRKVVVLANLKPRNMRGIKSHGMLLCASNESHDAVEPLDPPADAAVGERVWFGSEQLQPAPAEANRVQKKKLWEGVQPDLRTSNDRVAGFKGAAMMTSAGPVTAKSLAAASIS